MYDKFVLKEDSTKGVDHKHLWIIVFEQRSLDTNRKKDGVRKEEELGVVGKKVNDTPS